MITIRAVGADGVFSVESGWVNAMSSHLVIGYGATGATTARLLAEQGHSVKVVTRSPRPAESGIEHVALDATDSAALSELAQGADAIYNCANLPYHHWVTGWPPLAASLNQVAEDSGAVLVVLSNLYGYGPVSSPMTEDFPLASTGVKGRVRAGMWEDALKLHEQGRIRMVEVRACDFFGPGVVDGGHLASRAMPSLLRGRPVQVMGNPDAPHSWTYVPDVANAMIKVAEEEQAWGKAWHVPTASPLSLRAMVEKLAEKAQVSPVSVRQIPPVVLRVLSLFSPLLRELREVRYQFDEPFVVDSSAFTQQFGQEPTPIDEQIDATVQWWQHRVSEVNDR